MFSYENWLVCIKRALSNKFEFILPAFGTIELRKIVKTVEKQIDEEKNKLAKMMEEEPDSIEKQYFGENVSNQPFSTEDENEDEDKSNGNRVTFPSV